MAAPSQIDRLPKVSGNFPKSKEISHKAQSCRPPNRKGDSVPDIADQDPTVSDLATAAQLAATYGVTESAVRYYLHRWPECVVYLGDRYYFVRSRFEARLHATVLRPKKRKQKPPPSPNGAGSAANASE